MARSLTRARLNMQSQTPGAPNISPNNDAHYPTFPLRKRIETAKNRRLDTPNPTTKELPTWLDSNPAR